MHWKSIQSPRKKKAHEQVEIQSNEDFIYIRVVIYIDWVPEGQTVNQVYYKNIFKTLRERVHRRKLNLWKNASWILHQKMCQPIT